MRIQLLFPSQGIVLMSLLLAPCLWAQKDMKPEATEVWEPEPAVVTPGAFGAPPSDAVVLFDGSDFSKWQHETTGTPVQWTLNPDSSMTVKPGTGGIETRRARIHSIAYRMEIAHHYQRGRARTWQQRCVFSTPLRSAGP